MLIAIDKTNYKSVKKKKGNEYLYVYDNETYDELRQTGYHCVHKDYVDYVDINLTEYEINCIKKSNVNEKDYDIIPDKKDYKFAIIVPNCNNDHGDYKGKTFLRNCIESIINQTYKDFKLIIVDDCSTDNSIQTIESYKDDRIVLIKNKRKRYNGGSRNVGIDYALQNVDFDYLCFLDSDDFYTTKTALETINSRMFNHDMMLIGMQLIDKNGVFMTKYHQIDCYEDFFMSDNKVWCTAWSRIIKKNKIVYFPEDSLMEDRTWSYEQADNVDFNNIVNVKEPLYTWNRTNTTNSVSIVRDKIWEASAWKHVGQQLMLIERLKHKEMIPLIEKRIKVCIDKLNHNIYQQY